MKSAASFSKQLVARLLLAIEIYKLNKSTFCDVAVSAGAVNLIECDIVWHAKNKIEEH